MLSWPHLGTLALSSERQRVPACQKLKMYVRPGARCNPRPVATGRVSCVCDWLRDVTGLDSGDRSWICNAALDGTEHFEM